MIVNNIDMIATYGVTILEKDIQGSAVTNYYDWLDNSVEPTKLKDEKFKYSSIKVVLLVEGADEDEVLTKISNILVNCKNGTLKFDDVKYYFNISLTEHSTKIINNVAAELTLNFQSTYKYLDEVTNNYSTASFTVNCTSNIDTPCTLVLTVPIDTISISIQGFEDTITINNLKANTPVTITDKDVLENGITKFDDVDIWEFPKLKPGNNNITLSTSNCTTTIKYNPRFA